MPLLAAVAVAGHLACMPVHAATLGHSRLVSAVGEPLRITIPVTQISTAEIESLHVVPAPAAAWADTGLTPPVDLGTLQARLAEGYPPGSRIIQVWSDQVFKQPIADLLLDIQTSSGVQRYQVSLLARGGVAAVQAPQAGAEPTAATRQAASSGIATVQKPILVRRGDTMFAVARRHAVSGVSVYQMMIALQRANSGAFIQNNINLVKAGEQLDMPDMAALTAISDREARRLFHDQVVAFNAYRQGQGAPVAGDPATVQVTHSAQDASAPDQLSNIPESRAGSADQLKLSGGRALASATGTHLTDVAGQGQEQANGPTVTETTTGAVDASGSMAQNMASGLSKPAQAAITDGPGSSITEGIRSTMSGVAAGSGPAEQKQAGGMGSVADETVSAPVGVSNSGGVATPGGTTASGDATASSDVATPAMAVVAAGTEVADDGSRADDKLAVRKAIDDAEQRVSQLEENVKNLNRALQSQGEAAKDIVIDGAIGLRQSLTDVATAVTDATIGDEDFPESPGDTDPTVAAVANGSAPEGSQSTAEKNTMDSIISWVQANFVAAVVGLLALIVLIIAWVLRRMNVAQSRTESAVTPEMVKEKLDEINLDLNEPTVGKPPAPRS